MLLWGRRGGRGGRSACAPPPPSGALRSPLWTQPVTAPVTSWSRTSRTRQAAWTGEGCDPGRAALAQGTDNHEKRPRHADDDGRRVRPAEVPAGSTEALGFPAVPQLRVPPPSPAEDQASRCSLGPEELTCRLVQPLGDSRPVRRHPHDLTYVEPVVSEQCHQLQDEVLPQPLRSAACL